MVVVLVVMVLGVPLLGGRFGYFFFFSARGGGRGESEAPGREAIGFLLKIPGGGGVSRGGAEGKGVCLQPIGELGGGGLNIFYRGRNVHQVSGFMFVVVLVLVVVGKLVVMVFRCWLLWWWSSSMSFYVGGFPVSRHHYLASA